MTDEVRALHVAMNREALSQRSKFKREHGVLSQTFMEAMRIWDAQKVDGVPLLERIRGLERTLRAAWPQTREWKYLCSSCSDYGAVYHDCPGDATCGRSRDHLAHDYITACWCEKGMKFRPKKPEAEDFRAAGKSKPMSRMGR